MYATSGRSEADAGMKRAEDHANRVEPSWSERAGEFLRLYALRNATFTAEQVLAASAGLVPSPPDARAWGGVFSRARREGLITHHGYENAENPKVHCMTVRRWKSARYWGP